MVTKARYRVEDAGLGLTSDATEPEKFRVAFEMVEFQEAKANGREDVAPLRRSACPPEIVIVAVATIRPALCPILRIGEGRAAPVWTKALKSPAPTVPHWTRPEPRRSDCTCRTQCEVGSVRTAGLLKWILLNRLGGRWVSDLE